MPASDFVQISCKCSSGNGTRKFSNGNGKKHLGASGRGVCVTQTVGNSGVMGYGLRASCPCRQKEQEIHSR